MSISYAANEHHPEPPRMIDFKGHRFERDIILLCVRWYLAYPLSYRNLAEMMEERGVEVDPSNLYRWVQKFTPKLEAAFRKGKKRPVGNSWRMDETYIKILARLQEPEVKLPRYSALDSLIQFLKTL